MALQLSHSLILQLRNNVVLGILYCASRNTCMGAAWQCACECTDRVGLRVWNWDIDYTHCWTPHVAALALQALMAPLTHTLASLPSPAQLLAVCSVWSCTWCKDVKCLLFGSTCSCSRYESPDHMTRLSIDLQGWKFCAVLVANKNWSDQPETCMPETHILEPTCQKPAT